MGIPQHRQRSHRSRAFRLPAQGFGVSPIIGGLLLSRLIRDGIEDVLNRQASADCGTFVCDFFISSSSTNAKFQWVCNVTVIRPVR